nr:MAG TPA: hypothetical protein [Caudoviricetes sp.]
MLNQLFVTLTSCLINILIIPHILHFVKLRLC